MQFQPGSNSRTLNSKNLTIKQASVNRGLYTYIYFSLGESPSSHEPDRAETLETVQPAQGQIFKSF